MYLCSRLGQLLIKRDHIFEGLYPIQHKDEITPPLMLIILMVDHRRPPIRFILGHQP